MSKRILIADESDAIRTVALNLFRQRGHEVLIASNGPEAWEIAKSGKLDLAILNSALADVDGYTVSKLIKEDSALTHTKVILTLSASEIVNQHKLITAQADGTLNKPFIPGDLLTKAGEVLGESFSDAPSSVARDLTGSVSEMGNSDDQIPGKIDFDSIFRNEKNREPEDVHLEELFGDAPSAPKAADRPLEEIPPKQQIDGGISEIGGKSKIASSEDSIRLAEDQYGLEKPLEASEVETPHDYNWFIREMKSEIAAKVQTPEQTEKPSPKVTSKGDESTTGHFWVEEIGSSPINASEILGRPLVAPVPDEKKSEDITDKIPLDNTKADLEGGEGKLVLAEKLLIKELAHKLAERIAQQLPREKLQEMLSQVLSELKKF